MAPSSFTDPRLAMPLERERFTVVDVETTGLDTRRDRIVEVAVVGVEGMAIEWEFCSLVKVDGRVGAAAIHGLDAAALEGAPLFRDLVDELDGRLAGRVIAGHGVAFDVSFLEAELARGGRAIALGPRLCTLELATVLGVAEGAHRLARACAAQGIVLAGAHRALADARATARLLVRYLGLAEAAGLRTLGDLIEVAAVTAAHAA